MGVTLLGEAEREAPAQAEPLQRMFIHEEKAGLDLGFFALHGFWTAHRVEGMLQAIRVPAPVDEPISKGTSDKQCPVAYHAVANAVA